MYNSTSLFQGLPSFGPYKEERAKIIDAHKKTADLLDDANKPATIRPPIDPKKPIPSVKVCSINISCRNRT